MLVAVHTPQTRIHLRRRCLLIVLPDGQETRVPLEETERLLVGSRVYLSSAALTTLMGRDVPVVIISSSGRHLGSFEPPSPPRGATRRLVHLATSDAGFRAVIAGRIIIAKILNGRRALQRLNNRRPASEKSVLAQFKHLAREAERAASVESLRGIEGAAAARYFPLWARFLPPAFPFVSRSKRPPRNPVNAVLSFISALVHGEILSATLNRGFDPTVGCLHETTDDRHSLVLDLMEPFRPALIEPLTLRLFSLGILSEKHFRPHGHGIYLNDQGRSLLLEQYEDRLSRRFTDPRSGYRTTLRACLHAAPLEFKLSLANPACLNPFLLP
ncbi:MAG: CRISPR-associated endonuclease Cas1 [Akkermansiaceae bacterium]|nr:CRISPR-associated endonuclease Cas1 [Akkermansiaceae bacterium]